MDYISKQKTIHFIGIGGSGMSGLAKLLLEMGYKVSGTDLKETLMTVRLKNLGAQVFLGHRPENVHKANVVVVSTAISEDNPELVQAQAKKIPILKRAEMLAYLMKDSAYRIAVAGTHGKTTTSSILSLILNTAEKKPSFVIGAELFNFGFSATLGEPDFFVAEADESDGSFLLLDPNCAVITNLEEEHMPYFKTYDNLRKHFKQFMDKIIQNKGMLVINKDDKQLCELVESFENTANIIGFSIKEKSDFMARDIKHTTEGVRFTLEMGGKSMGETHLQLFGEHNIYNALAAISVAMQYNISIDDILKGVWQFTGTKRRFQRIGEVDGIEVFDDYAHHPTEIHTTLKGVKSGFDKRVICVFQPHRYSRTRDFLQEFPKSFEFADLVVITDIYSASESQIQGVSAKLIVDKMDPNKAAYVPKKSNVISYLRPKLKANDIIITMGAGDIHTVSKELLIRLKQ